MGVWHAMLEQQAKNLATCDMRAFRYTTLMKDFWSEQYMLAGAPLHCCYNFFLLTGTQVQMPLGCSAARRASV